MGKPHPSLQLTGAACLASAVCIEGTVAHRLVSSKDDRGNAWDVLTPERTPSPSASEDSNDEQDDAFLKPKRRTVSIEHQSGSIDVDVVTLDEGRGASVVVESCAVSRTARRLFEGVVYYYQSAA